MGAALVAGCTDNSGPGSGPGPVPVVSCADVTPTVLQPGEFAVIDPLAVNGCVRLPAAGAGGAEHLYVAVAAAGREGSVGVTTSYSLAARPTDQMTASVGAVSAPVPMPTAGIGELRLASGADQFHEMLRARERELSRSPAAQFF
nr:hypothetical protein [Gemmatimonadales bacterium]